MIFSKNIQFTLLIPVNSRQREFNFRKRSSELYDGDVTNERGERFYFKMLKQNDQWIMAGEQNPAWLLNSEPLISQGIIQMEEQE